MWYRAFSTVVVSRVVFGNGSELIRRKLFCEESSRSKLSETSKLGGFSRKSEVLSGVVIN